MNWRSGSVGAVVATAAAVALSSFSAAPEAAPRDRAGAGHVRWVNAWQGSPTGAGTFPAPDFDCPSDQGLRNQTVRNVVFLSSGGDSIRVRLTNAFGSQPLQVGAASVALAGSGAAGVPGTVRPLRFGGRSSILIAAGGEALSDPVPLRVAALQRLAVSVYLPAATGPATQHFFAQQDSFVAAGNQVGTDGGTAFDTRITCWLFLDGVDVRPSPRVTGTVVALGDSITDGALSTVNANNRYPDWLARRLNAVPGRTLAVSNAGIGGNQLLTNRTDIPFGAMFGPPAPARLPRDVLIQAGAEAVILLEGINDIGAGAARAADLIQVDQQIIAQARAAGLRVYGATLVPFGGSNEQFGGQYGTPAGERERQALNHWIRTSGAFDAVFDFDAALRDPARPDRMLPAYDSGDHLHPGDAGYRKMAETVDLEVLLRGR
jgi:lysophospholipase L1-like esterase